MAHFVATQPPRIRRLEHHGIPPRRKRSLAADIANPADFGVSSIEERLKLLLGEGPLTWIAFLGLRMGGAVPVEHDLGRMTAEQGLALLIPAVLGGTHVGAECPQRVLICPHGRVPSPLHSTHVREELIDVLVAPRPRPSLALRSEPADQTFAGLDGGEGQVAAQLLVAPAVQHLLEHLILRLQQPDLGHRDDPTHFVNGHRQPLHQMQESCI